MEYRRLGRTGLKVSTICLGTMQFGWSADEATGHDILNRAVELGCNFIDTADIYSRWAEGNAGGVSEQIIGRWLASGSVRRDSIVLATKVRGEMGSGPNDQGLSRGHILTAVENSLRRLQTDYLDLYQVHWPDEETPLEETLAALTDLVRAGKVRYIGCSNYPAWLLAKSLWLSDVHRLARFGSLQRHYTWCTGQSLSGSFSRFAWIRVLASFPTARWRRVSSQSNTAATRRCRNRHGPRGCVNGA